MKLEFSEMDEVELYTFMFDLFKMKEEYNNDSNSFQLYIYLDQLYRQAMEEWHSRD